MNFPSSLLCATKWACISPLDPGHPIDVRSYRFEVLFNGTLLNSTLLFIASEEIALTPGIKLPEQWSIRCLGDSLTEYTFLLEPGRILNAILIPEGNFKFNLVFMEEGKSIAQLEFVAY